MTSIVNNGASIAKYSYYTPSGNTVEGIQDKDDSYTKNADNVSISNKDRVTLSKAAVEAKAREAMGVSPTGRLKKKDIEYAARSQRESVESTVSLHLESLGFNPDLNISLTLDNENNIIIKENFVGKVDVEESLNNDSEFLNSFKRLSANNEILNYTTNLQIKDTTIANFLNSSSWGENRLMLLASRYEELTSTNNPLETLLGFSRQDTPYTYVHNPENDTVED